MAKADSDAMKLKATRARLGLTQVQMAQRLGVSFATVNRWENGQSKPSKLSWAQIQRLQDDGLAAAPSAVRESPAAYGADSPPPLDFTGKAEVVTALIKGERIMKTPYKPTLIPIRDLAWTEMIPRIGMAQAAVARFDGILQSMVNPRLLLSPLTTQEAVLSSRIEGTQASLEDVLRYDAAPRVDAEHRDDIKEVQNYRQALAEAVERVKDSGIEVAGICAIHKVLMAGVRGEKMHPGKVRKTQNFIGYRGTSIEDAIFIPPSPNDLGAALPELEAFMAATHRDTIVQTAMAHAQFELLHPFLDGNGRVGRILIPLLMYSKGLIGGPSFYISEYFEEHRPDYYNRLNAISEQGDWQGWVDFFLAAVGAQAELNGRRASAILSLYNRMKEEINRITRSQHTMETLDALFHDPFLTVPLFLKRTKIPRRSAFRILGDLEKARILTMKEEGSGRRPSVLAFTELIGITERKRF